MIPYSAKRNAVVAICAEEFRDIAWLEHNIVQRKIVKVAGQVLASIERAETNARVATSTCALELSSKNA